MIILRVYKYLWGELYWTGNEIRLNNMTNSSDPKGLFQSYLSLSPKIRVYLGLGMWGGAIQSIEDGVTCQV
jgi:hypothetical protein